MLGVMSLKFNVEERACELAEYIIENRATVRAAAKRFGISKSTVHKDVTERLRDIDLSLYSKVREILIENKSERHIRGGMATKQKYENIELVERQVDRAELDRLSDEKVRRITSFLHILLTILSIMVY